MFFTVQFASCFENTTGDGFQGLEENITGDGFQMVLRKTQPVTDYIN
jgi:hypothetical protein